QPLQIVEEKRQRVLRAGEYPKKAAEKRLEARLSLPRRKVGDRLLGSDDELAIRSQCLAQGVAPMSDLDFVPTQYLADQSLECLCQRRVGNITLVLIKLARCKKSAWRHKSLVKFIDYGRFSDAGIAGH